MYGFTDQAGKVVAAKFRLEFGELVNALVFEIAGQLVRHLGGGCAASGAEGKGVDFGEPGGATGLQRLLELGLGFTGKSDDDVGRDRRFVERFVEHAATIQKHPCAPASTHPTQHRVAARLKTQMDVGNEAIGILGHHADQAASHLGRFDAGQPDAEIAGQLAELSNQIRQPRPFFARFVAIPIDAVMPQMNPGQNDFAMARFGQTADFIDDVFERPRRQFGSHVGDDAVAASKQATVLHFDIRAMPAGKAVQPGGDVDDAEPRHQIGQFSFVGDDFGHPGQLGDFVGRPRGVTAHHDDSGSGIFPGHAANHLPAFDVTLIGDGAGVDDANVRLVSLGAVFKPDTLQALSDEFGFVLIDFATECGDA